MFAQLLINGLIAGAIYALVASGFSLIYSVCNFTHFGHGAIIAAGAYLLYTFYVILGINFLDFGHSYSYFFCCSWLVG